MNGCERVLRINTQTRFVVDVRVQLRRLIGHRGDADVDRVSAACLLPFRLAGLCKRPLRIAYPLWRHRLRDASRLINRQRYYVW